VTREWAWGDSTGRGARVCILDSGVQRDHPLVGGLEEAVAISVGEDDEVLVEEDAEGDVSGHGTACAGIVRALAPDCSLSSVRVLGANFTGSGGVLLAGLRYAVEQGYDVINMSLSTTKKPFAAVLHELADSAYFRRTVLVASAHNMPVESYPWRFSSVISVGSHEDESPFTYFYNPNPPVEFFGRGVNVDVAWLEGRSIRVSGNSFATPHLSGICALILAKHPELTPFQVKSVLYLTSSNVGGAR
jgi:subtilisin family serine protease